MYTSRIVEPLISWAWLLGLLFHYVLLSWIIIFVSFTHVICSGKNKLSSYLKLLSAPIQGSYFLTVRRNVVSGVYINYKGMVTFLMTETRLNARFKFYHAGLREARKIYFYPFL